MAHGNFGLMRALLLIGLAAACATSKPAARPSDTDGDLAPRPFTAEQLHDAMPVGSELRYRLEEVGKPTTIMVMQVTAADPRSVTIATRMLADDGTPLGGPDSKTSEWSALVRHASFPRAATRVSEATVETAAGNLPSIDYEVRTPAGDGSDVVTTYRFARSLPGPPAVLVREQGGVVVSRMTLISRK
jgi:hypothetical protein